MIKFPFAVLISGLLVQPAFANLSDVATILAKGRGASFEATTRSIHEPIVVEASGKTRKGQEVKSTSTSTPEEFGAAVRAKSSSRRVQSGLYTYQLEWEKVTSVGTDGALALYDIVAEIKENLYDPNDYEQDRPSMDGYYAQETRVLSITGPVVAMKMAGNNYYPGAAHPNYWEIFRTYDVRHFDKAAGRFEEANLLDIVDEAGLVQALKKDTALAKLIPKDSKKKFLASKTMIEMDEAVGMNLENCYWFPVSEGKMSSFALHSYDVKTNEVSIRVALTASAHVCAAEAPLLQLGLKVKATPEFRKILSAQVQNKDGLFMSGAAR
jgi:hypothetical protein